MAKKFRSVDTSKEFFEKRILTLIFFESTDDFEILSIINWLSLKKSTGAIDIPATLIKEAKYTICSHLTRIFNFALENVTYPVFKNCESSSNTQRRAKADLLNYTPISILSPFDKILETIIKNRL